MRGEERQFKEIYDLWLDRKPRIGEVVRQAVHASACPHPVGPILSCEEKGLPCRGPTLTGFLSLTLGGCWCKGRADLRLTDHNGAQPSSGQDL